MSEVSHSHSIGSIWRPRPHGTVAPMGQHQGAATSTVMLTCTSPPAFWVTTGPTNTGTKPNRTGLCAQ